MSPSDYNHNNDDTTHYHCHMVPKQVSCVQCGCSISLIDDIQVDSYLLYGSLACSQCLDKINQEIKLRPKQSVQRFNIPHKVD